MSQDGPKNSTPNQDKSLRSNKTAGLTAWQTPLRLTDLSDSRTHEFEMIPTAAQMQALREELGILSLKKMRFTGSLSPVSKRDWALKGKLGATISQSCVTTLEAVTTRIDVPVTRTYMSDYKDPAIADIDDEIEIPEDETVEALPAAVILSDIAAESLSMAMPDYPRADGAALEIQQFTHAGTAAMTDEDAKPFASLKSLRDKLEKGD